MTLRQFLALIVLACLIILAGMALQARQGATAERVLVNTAAKADALPACQSIDQLRARAREAGYPSRLLTGTAAERYLIALNGIPPRTAHIADAVVFARIGPDAVGLLLVVKGCVVKALAISRQTHEAIMGNILGRVS